MSRFSNCLSCFFFILLILAGFFITWNCSAFLSFSNFLALFSSIFFLISSFFWFFCSSKVFAKSRFRTFSSFRANLCSKESL